MQTSIAQVAALTIYGNAFLRGQNVGADFYPANGTFRFCEHVRFVVLHEDKGNWAEEPYAGDPLAWFETLRKQGVDTLRIQYGPSAQTAAANSSSYGTLA